MKQYKTPFAEMIGVNPIDVITSSGGVLSNLFDSMSGADNGNTFTGEAPSGWGMY